MKIYNFAPKVFRLKLYWLFGVFAGLVLAIFMLYPQARLMYAQGSQWQGNYAVTDFDEVAYAAYLQSLIDGKPRKNDPYAKLEDTPETPLSESLFSIQFASSYAVAIPSRILGLSAPAAMTISGILAAFLSTFVLFCLIRAITNDSLYAMTGCLVVFCCGALAGGEGAILYILGLRPAGPFFPGFRRYIPCVAFPFFFSFFGWIWLLLKARDEKRNLIYFSLAFFSFGFTLFSYFYLWTTLIAWLVSLFGLWVIARPAEWTKDLKMFAMLGVGCLLWLIPYGFLLSNRSQTTDDVQLLEFTHAPDFARVPIYIGIAVLIILAVGVLRRKIDLKEKSILFAASFALVPIIVHNQQIITGRSLQPVHYDLFAVNYLSLLALILVIRQLSKVIFPIENFQTRIALAAVCLAAVGWGVIECHFTTAANNGVNILRDKGLRIVRSLKNAGAESGKQGMIMSTSMWLDDDLPTHISKPVLSAFHQMVFNGLSREENKKRYYQLLYFQNISPDQLKEEMRDGNISPIIALFGWGRYSTRLSFVHRPLSESELDEEATLYNGYIANFNPRNSPETVLSHIVVGRRRPFDLSIIDKWYERGELERNVDFILYQVRLKTAEEKVN